MAVIKFKNSPRVVAAATAAGKKEYDGRLGGSFDIHSPDDTFGCSTFEEGECEMQRQAFSLALHKAGLKEADIGAIYAGDLMNQCTASAYGLLQYDISYFGLYGACSTMAQALMLAAMAVDGGYLPCAAAQVSSHNATAERQFRYPVEYGGQRTPTSQWTVTGSGCAIISGADSFMYITEALPGIVVDRKIKDANNMGAAMAPAAADTLLRYFSESGKKPSDFDLIVTGDLGAEGYAIVKELCAIEGLDLGAAYSDCGLLLYDETQDVHAGASGCGCSALVFSTFIVDGFRNGTFREALFIGTGALMSPMMLQQGAPIPGIAHLVRLSAER